MPYELEALGYAGLMWVLHFLITAFAGMGQLGLPYLLGNRDEQKTMSGVGGRLQRAMANYNEGLLLFGVAVVVVTLSQSSNATTEMCAGIFLLARLLYIPAYASGVFLIRTAVWAVGFFATLVMLVTALF